MATPIGNLDDISPRALQALAGADAIAAEDTRVTVRLLERKGVQGRLTAVHQHNERRAADWVVAELALGKTVALVTDAGTPAVSDPGTLVVARTHAAGFKVTPIPGPNAAVTALSASGIESGHFLFAGFLPAKPAARRKALQRLATLPYTLVLYEAPHRIVECVEDMAGALGPARTLVIARELTKLFEEIHRCELGEAAAWLREDANRERGEFVLVVEGAAESGAGAAENWEQTLAVLLAELPLAQAVKLTRTLTGAKKNEVYARALQLARPLKA